MTYKYSLGIDFGSNAARALLIDISNGTELSISEEKYSGGDNGIYTSTVNPHMARQNPLSYIEAMTKAVKTAMAKAKVNKNFRPENIIGIGIDATASTPLPITEDMQPLAALPKYKNNLDAYAWMWKDHTSIKEADIITEKAAKLRPEYLEKCGGAYSSEWFFSKIWHCLNTAPEVFGAAFTWVEFCDFIPAMLAGIKNPLDIKRSICAAGHKAMYSEEWGGLPDKEFLSKLSPKLAALLPRLYKKAYASDELAGKLSPEWAKKIGIPSGTPIAVGLIDAHSGAVGAGCGDKKLIKIIGTSACDIAVTKSKKITSISGVCGVAASSVVPEYYGIEAGQAAVGDIFNWFVSKICNGNSELFGKLTKEAAKLSPGESGLIALDWHNGNRCVLADQRLTGLMIGQTLNTTQAEIYRSLIEATAFGAKKIIDRLTSSGVMISEIITCGGIAEKNPLFMQIYADILNMKLKVTASSQSCALGAAIYGAVVSEQGYETVESAQKRICSYKDIVYKPIKANVKIYADIYKIYTELHDSFGKEKASNFSVMKKLLALKIK